MPGMNLDPSLGASVYPPMDPAVLPEAFAQPADFNPSMNFDLENNFSWEMIGLGLEEPLPLPQAVEELLVMMILSILLSWYSIPMSFYIAAR